MLNVSATVLFIIPPELIFTLEKVLVPAALLEKFKVPLTEVKPVTVKLFLPIVPEVTFKAPATFKVPVLVPPIVPPFNVRPPAPTLVVRPAAQFAVPLIVNDKQFPGLPFIVTVIPVQIITLSPRPGVVAAAAPAQLTVDHFAGAVQLPDEM